jgi:uncharacterized protein (TIGR02246 family)
MNQPVFTSEARLQQLEDRFAIQDLVAAYCRAIDDRDLEAFVSLFTEDCRMRHQDGRMDVSGRDALHAYYAERFPTYGVTFHYPHAHSVTFDGTDRAGGWVSAHAEMDLGGEFTLAAFRYSDQYVRDQGTWRFSERVLACWYYMRLADLPTQIGSTLRKHYKGQLLPAELPESLQTYQSLHTGTRGAEALHA